MKKNNNKLIVLIILDGWGTSVVREGNAVYFAKTPTFDKLWEHYLHSYLITHGKSVGLPQGLMGNSEVGHMNMGAGRIVQQDLTTINEAIEDRTFFQNPALIAAIQHVKNHNSKLHLIGLLSDGGVHSDIRHLYALLELAKKKGLKRAYIHGITDGQDTYRKSAIRYIESLNREIEKIGVGEIVSITGRYYSMDRVHNWRRIKKVYDMMVFGKHKRKAKSAERLIEKCYSDNITDEFIPPSIILKNSKPKALIKRNDAIIFFNLRSDRARQLTKPFVLDNFKFFYRGPKIKNLFFVGMTNFGDDLPMSIAFTEPILKNALPEVISRAGLTQLYISEEEKFAHVAYFFHGGTSIPFKGEKRIMIPSLDIKTYDLDPRMSAGPVTKEVLNKIKNNNTNFILMNYANPDMLGHTGNLKAAVKGLEFVDKCLAKVIKEILKRNGEAIVTADHGNVEEMIDLGSKEIDTKHSRNPVPFIIVSKKGAKKKNLYIKEGILADISPTILDLMNVKKPKEMTGDSLIF